MPRIVICGLGQTGQRIFSLLYHQGADVVGIHPERLSTGPLAMGPMAERLIVGDGRLTATLLQAGIREAQVLILASSDDTLNLAVLVQARVLNARLCIINRLFNTSLGERLDRTLVNHVSMSVSALSAPIFTFAALGSQAIGQLQLFGQTWPIYEEHIDDHHPWLGRLLSDLWDDRDRMLIYHRLQGEATGLVQGLFDARCLQVGDRLVVATRPSVFRRRNSFKRLATRCINGLRRFQQYGRSTLLVTLLLLSAVAIATLTYISDNAPTSMIDALYFAVGMITGAGGNEFVVEGAPAWVKLFTVLMMLVGAAIIGIFYALLNDFILGSRFRQLWQVAQVPARHHYIVCGMGGVGIQITRQLRANGHDVVVIEQDLHNRFLGTAQSLKVPVIHADATLANSLQAANLSRAAALLAVTSQDLTNIEIALTAKGLAPRLPVIVRSYDPEFARKAPQVFEFDAVLSPAELAAPSFAAAALGGRVLGNGTIAGSLWVALATLITPHHPLCGQSVKQAAIATDFVPLYLEAPEHTSHGWELLDTTLQAGHVLYLTLPAHRLERLWQPTAQTFIDAFPSSMTF